MGQASQEETGQLWAGPFSWYSTVRSFRSTCKGSPRVGLASRDDSMRLLLPHAKERGLHAATKLTNPGLLVGAKIILNMPDTQGHGMDQLSFNEQNPVPLGGHNNVSGRTHSSGMSRGIFRTKTGPPVIDIAIVC